MLISCMWVLGVFNGLIFVMFLSWKPTKRHLCMMVSDPKWYCLTIAWIHSKCKIPWNFPKDSKMVSDVFYQLENVFGFIPFLMSVSKNKTLIYYFGLPISSCSCTFMQYCFSSAIMPWIESRLKILTRIRLQRGQSEPWTQHAMPKEMLQYVAILPDSVGETLNSYFIQ